MGKGGGHVLIVEHDRTFGASFMTILFESVRATRAKSYVSFLGREHDLETRTHRDFSKPSCVSYSLEDEAGTQTVSTLCGN
jgi:hypothetical protein